MLYRGLIRPIMFRLDPEKAHELAVGVLARLSSWPVPKGWLSWLYADHSPELAQEIWGLRFEHPVGLAAGFDKNARMIPALSRMGFAFLEIGAVSSGARPGNPRPRIFRLPDDKGVINRMGLPNDGADVISGRLAALRERGAHA